MTFAAMNDDERRYVCEHRDEFPELDEEIKGWFEAQWAKIHAREDERARQYPDELDEEAS